MDKYGDVKVGDEFFYVELVGVKLWHKISFIKRFSISCLVIKVTRTQFITDKGRYRKSDGRTVGVCPSIYKLGDNLSPHCIKAKVFGCQLDELNKYKQDLLPIENARLVNLSRFDIADLRNIETAKEAASLIMQLGALIKESNK